MQAVVPTWSGQILAVIEHQGHIGIVSSLKNRTRDRFLIVGGQVPQDMLFDYPIIGQYRYAAKRE